MSDIYEQRGYGSRTLGIGAKLGVVVVDFQRGFTDGAFPMGGGEMVDQAVMPAALGQLDELSRTMAGVKAAGLSEEPWCSTCCTARSPWSSTRASPPRNRTSC